MIWLLVLIFCFFFVKQKTAYEMRISDWSSDVCSSDLIFGPMLTSRSKVELRDRAIGNLALLAAAGVKVAITTDHPVVPIEQIRLQEIGRASCRERVCKYV